MRPRKVGISGDGALEVFYGLIGVGYHQGTAIEVEVASVAVVLIELAAILFGGPSGITEIQSLQVPAIQKEILGIFGQLAEGVFGTLAGVAHLLAVEAIQFRRWGAGGGPNLGQTRGAHGRC